MSRLSHVAVSIGFLVASALSVVASSSAAEKDTMPPQTPSHQIVPEAASPGSGSGAGEPLSDKLDRQGGVIRPPGGIDPKMTQSPPAEGKMPVIPPPGTPGGDQGVHPK
jgi:hypothetical protein